MKIQISILFSNIEQNY